eukprot:scaffold26128_cov157-Cylindrotheca_fusiformis.AAC.3
MKVNTKKKFMGKFFQSKKNKKVTTTTTTIEKEQEVKRHRPEPEGRQANAEFQTELQCEPTNGGTEEEPYDEREASPETPRDIENDDDHQERVDQQHQEQAPPSVCTGESNSWMGFMENVTFMCGATPTNQPLPTIMSEEEPDEETVATTPKPSSDKAKEETEPILEKERAPSPPKKKREEPVVVVETVKEDDDDDDDGPPELVDEKHKAAAGAEYNKEPDGTKIDIFAGCAGMCFNPPLQSMDELDLHEEEKDKIQADGDPKIEEGAGKPTDDRNTSLVGGLEMEVPSTSDTIETPQVVADTEAVKAKTDQTKDEPNIPSTESAESTDYVIGTIFKEKRNTKMGLSLKNSTMFPGVFVAKIKPNSLFSKTALREGMKVLKIRGEPCPIVLEDAVALLRRAEGELEIIAEKPKCEI